MKVVIEKIPSAYNTPAKNYEFYDIIQKALLSKSIDEFMSNPPKRDYGKDLEYFAFGSGASHIWVHEKDWRGSGKIEKERLLFITES